MIKFTFKYLSMAALALLGSIMTSCSSEDDLNNGVQQGKIVTLTTTISLGKGGAQTRALDADGHKTFAEKDQIAFVYKNTKGATLTANAVLSASDISADGKQASITVKMDNPAKNSELRLIYPATMAKADIANDAVIDDDATINYDCLLKEQDGTLSTLGSDFDLAVFDGTMNGDQLPSSITLKNQLAVCALTIKNADGSQDITSTITNLSVSDGTDTYTINRKAADGPIYVAMKPVAEANIELTATDDNEMHYSKSLTGKTYAANNLYPLGMKMARMVDLSKLTADFTAQDGDILTGTLAENHKISIAADATVTLSGVSINDDDEGTGKRWSSGDYAGLTCLGKATIVLADGTTNTIKGFDTSYPGIEGGPEGTTLTIEGASAGTGKLITFSTNGAGIGSQAQGTCGNIIIRGGTVNATSYNGAGIGTGTVNSTCGYIAIRGGTVTATAQNSSSSGGSAGIGSGLDDSTCGDITITGGKVKAYGAPYGAGIGSGGRYKSGSTGSCSEIRIKISKSSSVYAQGGAYAAGIGTGAYGNCVKITVETGTVTANRNNGSGGGSCYDIGLGVGGSIRSKISVGASVKTISKAAYNYVSSIKGYNHE
jgi:hypothetical protein